MGWDCFGLTVRQLLTFGEHIRKLPEIVGLLKNLLETADFKKLRSESEKHLLEGRDVKFAVHLEDGTPKYEMLVS